MSVNLFGIFLFASLFNYSIQTRCYHCATTKAADLNKIPQAFRPNDLPTVICPDPLTDAVTKDCPQDCAKVDLIVGGVQTVYRSCAELIDCNLYNTIAGAANGKLNFCGQCDKDRCNSAISTLASTSLLGICVSFLAFKIIIS